MGTILITVVTLDGERYEYRPDWGGWDDAVDYARELALFWDSEIEEEDIVDSGVDYIDVEEPWSAFLRLDANGETVAEQSNEREH